MNRSFSSLRRAFKSRGQALMRRLLAVIGAAVLSATYHASYVQAQDSPVRPFYIVDDVPPGGFKLHDTSYILLRERFEFIPMMFYEHDTVVSAHLFEDMFSLNPNDINFTLNSDYYSPADKVRETYEHKAESISADPEEVLAFTTGRYRHFERVYNQVNPNPNPGPGEPLAVGSRIKGYNQLHRVTIKKIPYYIQLELLSDPELLVEDHPILRFFEGTQYNELVGLQASRTATDMYEPAFLSDREKHIGCPVWYEFKFMGYVDGFPGGLTNVDGATMGNLPDGVTFVSDINECSTHGAPGDFILGCATTNGTKIAMRMDLLMQKQSNENNLLGPVLLHELAHAYGIADHHDDPDNFMSARAAADAPHVNREQCDMLAERKVFKMGFNGLFPWGDAK